MQSLEREGVAGCYMESWQSATEFFAEFLSLTSITAVHHFLLIPYVKKFSR
jgi:hypothetical protein